jgi:uncharacterized protein YjdB
MTFKHKLSRRLALLRNVVLLGAVCATAACDLRQLLGLLGPVASVTVAPATASVPVGQTVSLAATPRDSTGGALIARLVTWASSAPAVATVSSSGVVTGVVGGTATITATSEGQSGTSVVTVVTAAPAPVASVAVDPVTASAPVGQAVVLAATPKDANGNPLTARLVTWASGTPAVAAVSSNGVVTGVAAGSATITATSEGQNGSAAITVMVAVANPAKVNDLRITSVTDSSVTLSFLQVNDGTGQPASYIVKYGVGALTWSTGLAVARGTCLTPVVGTAVGTTQSCTVVGLSPTTGYQFGIVSFRGDLSTNAVFGPLSNLANGTTAAGSAAAVALVTVSPANPSVAVGAVQQFTATLKDAAGRPLSGRTVTWSSNALPVATVSGTGLVTGVAVGSATITATSEGQSGSATLTVSVAPPAPSGAVLFESDWSTALGNDPSSALRDGGRWGWEADWGGGKLMSVVAGGPGGRNALRVLQRGGSFAAFIGKNNVLPVSKDYYVRYYMRNDDTSPAGDHIVTPDYQSYGNLTYMRKYSSSNGWRFVISMYGCSFTYPISHIGLGVNLARGVWYRLEYHVHFVDPTHIQVHVRIYDQAGVQIFGDADFRQEAYGTQVWNGRSDWTLASLYASGFSYCVNPSALTKFAMGNNGNQGAVDTGLPWYFANLQIRSDRWPGP